MASGGNPQPSIVVHHIPDGVDEEYIELFFSAKRNGGAGDVEGVTFPLDTDHPQSARVIFSSLSTVLRICSAERVFKGKKLHLEPENAESGDSCLSLITVVRSCPVHPGEEVRYVCLTEGCGSSLICALCIRDTHNGHAWTLIEEEMRTKKQELQLVVLPQLEKKAEALEAQVDEMKRKKQEADGSLAAELTRVGEREQGGLGQVRAEYDDNLRRLKHDLADKEARIKQEVKTVCDTIRAKWDAAKTALSGEEQKLSRRLAETKSVMAAAQQAQAATDLKAVMSTITRGMTCAKTIEKPGSQTSSKPPDTPVNLDQYSELSVAVQPKPGLQQVMSVKDTLTDLDPAVVLYLELMVEKGYGVIKNPQDYGLIKFEHDAGNEFCKILFFDGIPTDAKRKFKSNYEHTKRMSVGDRMDVPGMCPGLVDRTIEATKHRRPDCAAVRVGEKIKLRGTQDAIDRELQALEMEVVDGKCGTDCAVCGDGRGGAAGGGQLSNQPGSRPQNQLAAQRAPVRAHLDKTAAKLPGGGSKQIDRCSVCRVSNATMRFSCGHPTCSRCLKSGCAQCR